MTIYQVTHKAVLLAQQIRNVFYYETQVGEPGPGEWVDIVDEIRADFIAEMAQRVVEEYSFYAIEYREVDSPGLPSFEVPPTAGDALGTDPGDPLPTQVAMLVSVKGTTTKPRNARSYLAGLSVSETEDGIFGTGARGDAEAFIDLNSVLNAGGTNPLQRVAVQWNQNHTEVTVWNNIAGSAARASVVPATQRRRRIGVGI
jgi:hypothetical protein